MKATGLKRPTPVGQTSTPASQKVATTTTSASEPAPDNDPIALTLQQREALGGANNQCTDLEAQKKKFKVFRAARLAFKGANFVDFVGGGNEDASGGARPATAAGAAGSRLAKPATRPGTAATKGVTRASTKKASGAADESSVSLNENLAGVDDPIAVSMQDRIKTGGLSSQIKEVDAKKQGIKIFRAPKHTIKAGAALVSFVEDDASAAGGSNLRVPSKQASHMSSPSPIKKRIPTAGSSTRQTGLIKPKSTNPTGETPATSQLDGDLSEDPIAQSLTCRIKLGGFGSNATEADAKKNSYPVFKATKHPALKGNALVDIGAPPKQASDAVAASPLKPAAGKTAAKGLKPPTKIKPQQAPAIKKQASEVSAAAVSADVDPIGAALKARQDAGGLNSQIKELDAKKQKVFVPAPLKLKAAGKDALISWDLPAQEPASASKQPTFSGTPMKSAPQRSNTISTPAKTQQTAKVRDEPVDESDPIDVAMRDRKNAGSADSVINAADAKKKKLQIPQALGLTLDKPKETLITFLTPEMIAADEAKAKETPQQSTSSKASSAPADFATDPIDYTMAQRVNAGGPTSHMNKADAAKDKIQTVDQLNLVLANEKATFQDLEPTMNQDGDRDAFKGFKNVSGEASTKVDLAAEAAAQQQEEERLAAEKAELEKAEAEELRKEEEAKAEEAAARAEQEAAAKAEADRLEQERQALEAKRLQEEEARLEQERQEMERKQADKEAQEKAEKERLEQERLAQEEADRLEAERVELERQQADKEAQEKAEKEKAEQEKQAQEEADRLEAERVEMERQQAEKEAAAKAEADRAEQERLAQDENERLEAERAQMEKQQAEKEAQEKAEAERLAAEQAEAERVAAEKAEAEKVAAEQVEAERLEAERLAAQEEEKVEEDMDQEEEPNELSALEGELSGMNEMQESGEIDDGLVGESPRDMKIDKSHVAKADSADATQAQSAAAASNQPVEVDGSVIKAIWPFVRPSDRLPGDGMIQNEGQELAQELKQELVTAMGTVNVNILAIKAKFPDAEPIVTSAEAFQLSQMTKDGIEIIEEMGIDFNDWVESSVDSEWTIRTLKIWFFLQKDFSGANAWAAWPNLFDDSAFMEKACDQIEDVIEEFHQHLIEKSSNFFCEDPEIMLRAECLIKHLGGSKEIDPSGEECDSSVGTFIMFVLRDFLEFSGLLPEKKRVPAKELALLVHKKSVYEGFIAQLSQQLGE